MARKSKTRRLKKRPAKAPGPRKIRVSVVFPTRTTFVLFAIGIFFIAWAVVYRINRNNYLSFRSAPAAQNTPLAFRDGHLPVKLFIDTLDITLPVEESSIRGKTWEISERGISHLDISAYPGLSGNVVMYGHNTDEIFGKLTRIRIGDPIEVTTKDGDVRRYRVTGTKTVDPDELTLLQPTKTETLTIYTCTGLFDSKRFVVRAEPL